MKDLRAGPTEPANPAGPQVKIILLLMKGSYKMKRYSLSIWKLSTSVKVGTTLRLGPNLCTVLAHFHGNHLVLWRIHESSLFKPPFLLL